MLRDVQDVEILQKQKFDYVIVGSGAAGTTFAIEKVGKGASVLMIESGTPDSLRENYLSHRARITDGALRTGDRSSPANPWTLRVLGGGMTRYAGIMMRYRTNDFRRSGDLPDATMNPDWPFSYDELKPHYDWVERRVGIARSGTGDRCAPEAIDPVMPPHPVSSRAQVLNSAFAAHQIPYFPTPLAINSTPYRDRPACTYCGYCNEEFCAIGAKANPFHALGRFEAEPKTPEVVVDHHVVRLTRAPGSDRFDGVECYDGDGQTRFFRGEKIVIAAGALQSTSILLRSRPQGSLVPPGDHSSLLGRGIQFKLTGYSSVASGPSGDDADPLSLFTTSATTEFYEQVGDSKPGGFVYEAACRDEARKLRVHFVTPEAPRSENFVEAAGDAADSSSLKVNITHTPLKTDLDRREALGSAVESVLSGINPQVSTDLEANSAGLAHLAGGCRSGADPSEAVTDPSGRVYGYGNVVVADSATFPYTAAINPTMTIMANAHRLAEIN